MYGLIGDRKGAENTQRAPGAETNRSSHPSLELLAGILQERSISEYLSRKFEFALRLLRQRDVMLRNSLPFASIAVFRVYELFSGKFPPIIFRSLTVFLKLYTMPLWRFDQFCRNTIFWPLATKLSPESLQVRRKFLKSPSFPYHSSSPISSCCRREYPMGVVFTPFPPDIPRRIL